ncbi:MAG TPA: hypothetical protein V6C97_18520 [Oculatellaceae cyanobacterium]
MNCIWVDAVVYESLFFFCFLFFLRGIAPFLLGRKAPAFGKFKFSSQIPVVIFSIVVSLVARSVFSSTPRAFSPSVAINPKNDRMLTVIGPLSIGFFVYQLMVWLWQAIVFPEVSQFVCCLCDVMLALFGLCVQFPPSKWDVATTLLQCVTMVLHLQYHVFQLLGVVVAVTYCPAIFEPCIDYLMIKKQGDTLVCFYLRLLLSFFSSTRNLHYIFSFLCVF